MLTVTLKPDVAEQVRQLAEGAQTEAETIVDEALRTFLAQARREKLEAETRAFEQQRPDLLNQYYGEYVAMDKGRLSTTTPTCKHCTCEYLANLCILPCC